MRVCTKCGLTKEKSEYNTRKSICKKCQSSYLKQHYIDNKEYYVNKRKRYRKNVIDMCDDYKRNLNCMHCDISFKDEPYLCDFHHTNDDKEFEVSTKRRSSYKKFIEEAKKCIALCPICHRREHYRLK